MIINKKTVNISTKAVTQERFFCMEGLSEENQAWIFYREDVFRNNSDQCCAGQTLLSVVPVPPPADRPWSQRCSETRRRPGQTGCCLGWSRAWSRNSGVRRRRGHCAWFYLPSALALPRSTWAGNSGANRNRGSIHITSSLFSRTTWLIHNSTVLKGSLGMIWDNSVHRSGWLTFPAPVDPATASIFPFSRCRLMFLRTGVTYRLVKKRPGSLFMCPFALFSCLIFSYNSLIPCSRIHSASVHCCVCTETSRLGEQWHMMCCFTDVSLSGSEVQREQQKILLLLSTHCYKKGTHFSLA